MWKNSENNKKKWGEMGGEGEKENNNNNKE